jgi:hypothetical protein
MISMAQKLCIIRFKRRRRTNCQLANQADPRALDVAHWMACGKKRATRKGGCGRSWRTLAFNLEGSDADVPHILCLSDHLIRPLNRGTDCQAPASWQHDQR